MKQFWFLLVALSVGLNGGFLYMKIAEIKSPHHGFRGPEQGPPGRHSPPPHQRPPAPDQMFRMHLENMVHGLELDAGQAEELRAAHGEILPQIAEKMEEHNQLRRALADRFSDPHMDPREFRIFAGDLFQAQRQLDSLIVEAMLNEAAVLTPEQRRQYSREMPWSKGGGHPPPGRR